MHTILFLLIYFHIIVICVSCNNSYFIVQKLELNINDFNMGLLANLETVSSNEGTVFTVYIIHNYIYIYIYI